MSGRVIAFHRGDGFVYWAGDATAAYSPAAHLARFVRHVLFVRDAYFVIFDDLALAPGAEPATFQCLYHVYPAVPLELSASPCSARYAIGSTKVLLQHASHASDLTIANRRGVEGMVNPVTGEDLTGMGKWNRDSRRKNPKPLDAHHLWISHRIPRRAMQFLAVVVPYRGSGAAPEVEALERDAVRVALQGRTDVIAFRSMPGADIVVDAHAIAQGWSTVP